MSDVLDDLMYSSEALAARFLLFQGLNDINLIVGDKDREYIYETIFKRMLGEQYHISTIFAAGVNQQLKIDIMNLEVRLMVLKIFILLMVTLIDTFMKMI